MPDAVHRSARIPRLQQNEEAGTKKPLARRVNCWASRSGSSNRRSTMPAANPATSRLAPVPSAMAASASSSSTESRSCRAQCRRSGFALDLVGEVCPEQPVRQRHRSSGDGDNEEVAEQRHRILRGGESASGIKTAVTASANVIQVMTMAIAGPVSPRSRIVGNATAAESPTKRTTRSSE